MDETSNARLSPTPRATDSSWNSLEKGVEKTSTFQIPRDTYGGLAEQTSVNHDVLIVRQFSVLNARNLFLMQAELVALENRLKLDEQEVIKEGKTKYLQNWQYLERSAHEEDRTALEYRSLVYEIRQRLKEYSEMPLAIVRNFPLTIVQMKLCSSSIFSPTCRRLRSTILPTSEPGWTPKLWGTGFSRVVTRLSTITPPLKMI
jgi:hypothetical protein